LQGELEEELQKISFEERVYYIGILATLNIQATEPNIQQLHRLDNAAKAAGFKSDYLFGFSLPSLARAGILTEANLSDIGNKLVEIGKASYAAGFKPDFGFSLPTLVRTGILTEANLSELVELGKEIYRYQADAKLLIDKIPDLINRGFSFSDILPQGKFHEKILLFIKTSGRYFTNNISFLDTLTPENIDEEIDSVLEYFSDLGIPLYLPKLYSMYSSLDSVEQKELFEQFRDYFYKQLNGIGIEDTELPDDIIEEADFYIIGSTNLTIEEYRNISSRFEGEEIPDSNFKADFRIVLNLSSIVSNLSEEDIEYLRGRIDWLEEIIETPLSNYIAEVLAQFYTHFLVKKNIPERCDNLGTLIDVISEDEEVMEAINSKDTKDIRDRIIEIIERGDFQEAEVVSEIFSSFTSEEEGIMPSVGMLRKLIRLKIAQMYATEGLVKEKISRLIGSKESLIEERLSVPELYELVNDLIEVLTEVKPEAKGELRGRIDVAVEMVRIRQLLEGFSTSSGDKAEEIRFLASKTKLDYFYGYFGENCASNNPQELLNPHFTPLRIITSKGIEGAIHTLTYEIDGKKSLIIVGIEPQSGLVLRINPREFTQELLEKIIEEAIKEGYDQILIATNPAAQSNREQIREEIQRLIKGRDIITQNAQSKFLGDKYYDITEVTIYWQR